MFARKNVHTWFWGLHCVASLTKLGWRSARGFPETTQLKAKDGAWPFGVFGLHRVLRPTAQPLDEAGPQPDIGG